VTGNLFDYVEALSARDGAGPSWTVRTPRRPEAGFDAMLLPRVPRWEEDEDAREALRRIEREPWVESVSREDGQVRLRFDDDWIASTGAALEAGGSAEAGLADLGAGKHVAVEFWDANATKALHVGHLRNLAIGNALAAALAQAGAQVERRSLISDAGRSMGEAMAGVLSSGRTVLGSSEDEKSDHFVGLCYADYVSSLGSFSGRMLDDSEDSFIRELTPRGDTAEDLLKRVLSGDREVLELWYRTRAWVIAGQRKTLARLGIAFDRVSFESDFLAGAAELVATGLREGKLERRADGVVVYETGREEFDEFPLVRADGLPTQHLRAISYWMASAPSLGTTTSIQICGSEWVGHAICINQLMNEFTDHINGENGHASNGHDANGDRSLGDGARDEYVPGSRVAIRRHTGNGALKVHPTHDVFHGMVARQKRAMTSSEGALLIDNVTDWIDEQIDADPDWRQMRRRHPFPEKIAGQIALGFFLPSQPTPRIDFEPEKLLRDDESLGWDLVRARAGHGLRTSAKPGKPAEDPAYRFAVVQSELYRRYLRLAVDRLDVRPLAKYLRHLARWHMEADHGEHVERVVQTLLDRSARGLGLESTR
jgi:arginyl-tRNA synthetase